MTISLKQAIKNLPAPLNGEPHHLLRRGIYDAEDANVYVNEAGDFAFLFPIPTTDYVDYKPRVKSLSLINYKKLLRPIEKRYAKVAPYLTGITNLLEIGAADGVFLAYVQEHHPDVSFASLEKDMRTTPQRDQFPWLHQWASFDDIHLAGVKYDVICAFHVFEHIPEPASFLGTVRRCLAPEGQIILEVPSLDDPLLRLYVSKAYEGFYFQRQHPYVYSAGSLARVLTHNSLLVEKIIAHQRYGLENHLNWLIHCKPGGNEKFRRIFVSCEEAYVQALEKSGVTDSIIAIARDAA